MKGEFVGLYVGCGVCFGFCATATRVWQPIDPPRTVDAGVAHLVPEHEVAGGEGRPELSDLFGGREREEFLMLASE